MDSLFSQSLTRRQPHVAKLFTASLVRGKLAHAYLLVGRSHEDKWLIARHLAQFLNCQREDKLTVGSCLQEDIGEDESANWQGACQNCRWLFKNEHPKAWYVLSDEAGKSGKIPVEAARNLSEELSRSSEYARVIVVEEANEYALHRPCANALLKTIEEPKSRCLFLLFSQGQDSVLQTIVSRCQVVPLVNDARLNLGPLRDIACGEKKFSSMRLVKEKFPAETLALLAELGKDVFFTPSYKLEEGRLYCRGHLSAKDALALAGKLCDLLDEEVEAEALFDACVEFELRQIELAGAAVKTADFAAYLNKLLKLQEGAKRSLNQYVGKKAVCDSFVLSWHELRQNLK